MLYDFDYSASEARVAAMLADGYMPCPASECPTRFPYDIHERPFSELPREASRAWNLHIDTEHSDLRKVMSWLATRPSALRPVSI